MRKIFNYSFLVVFLFSAIAFIYSMANLSETSIGTIVFMMFSCIASFIFYIMTEKNASEETVTWNTPLEEMLAVSLNQADQVNDDNMTMYIQWKSDYFVG